MSENEKTQQGSSPSRRQFLQQTGATGATLAAAAALSPTAFAQGSDEIRIALVGTGGRGTGAADQALQTAREERSDSPPVRLVAMADIFEDRLESHYRNLERKYGNEGSSRMRVDVPESRRFVGFDGFKKAIDTIETGRDYVILATPPGYRPQHFEYAVEQGRNVFMEKPVATDAPGIRRVLAAAEKAEQKNLKVGVGLQRHHQREYIETIDRIHNGEIGDVHTIYAYWNGSTPWVRTRSAFERQLGRKPTEMEYQLRNWYFFPWICGDHIVEQHIHNLDIGNWIKRDLDNPHPIAARGMGGREVRTGKDHGQIFDHHAVEFWYADGTRMISQCRHMQGCWNEVSEWAVGSKGSASVSGAQLYSDHGFRQRKWRYRGDRPNPYQVEHDNLVDAIVNDRDHMEARYGAEATFTAILGRMATYSGKGVSSLRWSTMLRDGGELAPGQDNYDFNSKPPVQPDSDGYYPVPVPGEYDPKNPLKSLV